MEQNTKPSPTALLHPVSAQDIADTVRESLLILDESLHVTSANRSFYTTFHVDPQEIEGRLIYELGKGQWDIPDLHRLLEEIIPHQTASEDFRVEHHIEQIGRRILLLNARRVAHNGEPGLILLAIEDITEKEALGNQLAESEATFHKFVDDVNSIVIGFDRNGNISFFNGFSQRLFGYSREEVIGKPFVGTIIPVIDSKGNDHSCITRQIFDSPERFYANEHEGRKKDGAGIFFTWNAKALRNKAGEITEILIDGNDITDLRQTQDALHIAAERFDRIASANIVGVIIAGYDGSISFANDSFLDTIGYTREEYDRGEISWITLTPPEYLPRDYQALDELSATCKATPYEKEYIRKDGSRIWVLLADVILPGSGRDILAFVLDITERKRALMEAQTRRAEIEAILNSLPDGYIIYDSNGSIRKINDIARGILGFTDDKIALPYEERMRNLEPLTSSGEPFALDQIPSFRAMHGEIVRDTVMRIKGADRDYWISVSASPIIVDGTMNGAIMEFSDITPIGALQDQLTAERNFIEAVLQTSGALTVVVDREGRFIRFNRSCERLSGFRAE